MSFKLTKVGALAVHNSEVIPEIRQKIAGTSRLAGFSDFHATRLAATASEIGRRLLSMQAGAMVGVYLHGASEIEGLALSFPEYEAVAEKLRE